MGALLPAPCKEKVSQAHQRYGEIVTKGEDRFDLRPCGERIDRAVQPAAHPALDADHRTRQEVVGWCDRHGSSFREADQGSEGLLRKLAMAASGVNGWPVPPGIPVS